MCPLRHRLYWSSDYKNLVVFLGKYLEKLSQFCKYYIISGVGHFNINNRPILSESEDLYY